MSLLGRAVVAIWNDILPEGRTNFIDWHNRQHIPERVAITGFLRGRRYIAEHGTPEYFTLYEAVDEAVLAGAEYLERLNNPTPWTQDATKAFRNTVRGVCTTLFTTGPGDGGTLATLRFSTAPGTPNTLSAPLKDILTEIARTPSLSGVHVCVADQAVSGIKTKEREGRDVAVPNWIVMIEGSWGAAVDEALDRLLASQLIAQTNSERGLYRLEHSLEKGRTTPAPHA